MQMIGLYRDPHGENIFEISKSMNTSNATEAGGTTATLRKKVSELERELTQVGVIACEVTENHAYCVIVTQEYYYNSM